MEPLSYHYQYNLSLFAFFQVMTIISNEKVTRTGPKTVFKYDFISDRSEPQINISFLEEDLKLEFKTSYLTVLDILYEMNKYVLPFVKEDLVEDTTGKPAGKGGKGGKGGKDSGGGKKGKK